METGMRFKQNTPVFAANGSEVGNLSRVVLKTGKNEVTHIVVRMKGLLHRDEKLLPIDQVVQANDDRLSLNDTAGELDGLPLYEEKQYNPVDEGPGMLTTPPITSAPLSGVPQPAPPLIVTPGSDRYDLTSGRDKFETTTDQNIPTDTQVLKLGAKISSVEGEQLGTLETIVAAKTADHPVTHLVVIYGLLAAERKLVPVDWIGRIDPEDIHLGAAAGSLQHLDNI
jgi:uncharacterized protein YrrD